MVGRLIDWLLDADGARPQWHGEVIKAALALLLWFLIVGVPILLF